MTAKSLRRKRRIAKRNARRIEHDDTQRALAELAVWKLIDHVSSHGLLDIHKMIETSTDDDSQTST